MSSSRKILYNRASFHLSISSWPLIRNSVMLMLSLTWKHICFRGISIAWKISSQKKSMFLRSISVSSRKVSRNMIEGQPFMKSSRQCSWRKRTKTNSFSMIAEKKAINSIILSSEKASSWASQLNSTSKQWSGHSYSHFSQQKMSKCRTTSWQISTSSFTLTEY